MAKTLILIITENLSHRYFIKNVDSVVYKLKFQNI